MNRDRDFGSWSTSASVRPAVGSVPAGWATCVAWNAQFADNGSGRGAKAGDTLRVVVLARVVSRYQDESAGLHWSQTKEENEKWQT